MNLEYNFLNLVGGVKAGGQTVAEYRWLADGTKVGVMGYGSEGFTEGGFEYLGSLIYTRDGDDLTLESASFGGGRIKVSESSEGNYYTPNYFITDHLGSTRVVAAFGGDGIDILDRSDYYPYGLRCEYPEAQASDNRWLYNGKELQIAGLPSTVKYLDYGARIYDPRAGRWIVIDPLARKYYPISPYAYVGNNPVRRTDPTGKTWVDANKNNMWGNGGYTQHATPEFRRVGDAMRTTETGRAAFDGVANLSATVQLNISPEAKLGQDGITRGDIVTNTAISADGNTELLDATITIYEGSIQAEVNGPIYVDTETGELIRSLPSDTAVEGAIGSVAVHEAIHTTPENVQQKHENSEAKKAGKELPHDVEKKPKQEQNNHLREL